MADRHPRGIIDTSIVIALESIDAAALPVEVALTTITLAELAAGPHATDDPSERGRRQERLQHAEAMFDALPFDSAAARAYGRVYSGVVAAGRKARGARAIDLLIASVAVANDLPLFTLNQNDFRALEDVLQVVGVSTRS